MRPRLDGRYGGQAHLSRHCPDPSSSLPRIARGRHERRLLLQDGLCKQQLILSRGAFSEGSRWPLPGPFFKEAEAFDSSWSSDRTGLALPLATMALVRSIIIAWVVISRNTLAPKRPNWVRAAAPSRQTRLTNSDGLEPDLSSLSGIIERSLKCTSAYSRLELAACRTRVNT